jgi:hypothetical protein
MDFTGFSCIVDDRQPFSIPSENAAPEVVCAGRFGTCDSVMQALQQQGTALADRTVQDGFFPWEDVLELMKEFFGGDSRIKLNGAGDSADEVFFGLPDIEQDELLCRISRQHTGKGCHLHFRHPRGCTDCRFDQSQRQNTIKRVSGHCQRSEKSFMLHVFSGAGILCAFVILV